MIWNSNERLLDLSPSFVYINKQAIGILNKRLKKFEGSPTLSMEAI